jgi:hypothetical protein
MEWLASAAALLGRIAGWLLDQLPPRRFLRVRLDVREGKLWAAVAYEGGGGKTIKSYEAAIRVSNSGKSRVTVESAGWIAADGEKLKAWGPETTLEPGGPTHELTKSVDEVLNFGRAHRGIQKAYVHVAGEDDPRIYPVSNEWRTKVLEATGLPKEECW